MATRIAAFLGCLACLLLAGPTALAATVNWDGSDFGTNTNWGNAANWSAGVPTNLDDAVFNAALPFDPGWNGNVTIFFGDTAKSVAFQGALPTAINLLSTTSSQMLTLDGAAPLTNAATGAAVNVGDGSGNLTLLLNSPASVISNSGILNLKDYISYSNSLTFTGSGTTTISGSAFGYGGLIMNGLGQLVLAGPNGSITDSLTVNSGKISAAISSTVNPLGTGAINLAGGTLDLTPTASTAAAGLSGRSFAAGINDTARLDYTQIAASIRTDATINMTSTGGAPLPSSTATQWIGKVNIATGGAYQFQIASDDGSRLFVDGVLVIQNDGPKGETAATSAPLTLSAGLHDIRMDYVNVGGNGAARLRYQGPDMAAMGIIPSTALFQAESNSTFAASNAVVVGSGLGNDLNVSGNSTINLNGAAFTQVQLGNAFFNNGSTLNLTSSAGVQGRALRIAGAATFGSGVTLNAAGDGSNGADFYFDGVLSDGFAATTITKTGNGQLVFSQTGSTNSLLPGTTFDVQAGTLHLIGSSVGGSNNPIGAAGIVMSGGNLLLDSKIGSQTAPTTYANAITVNQNGTIQDIVSGGSLVDLTGAISIAAGKTLTLDAIAGGSPVSSLAAVLRLTGPLTGSGTLAVNSSSIGTLNITPVKGSVLLTGDISGFSGNVKLLGGNFRYVNAPTELAGGNLEILDDGNGNGAPQAIDYTAASLSATANSTITVGRLGTTYAPYYPQAANKTIQLTLPALGANSLTIVNNNGYGVDFTNPVALTGPLTLGAANATASNVVQGVTVSGAVSGAQNVVKIGAGTLVLGNSGNTFGGAGNMIDIQAGAVSVASDGALGNAANVVNLNANTLRSLSSTTTASSTTVTVASTAGLAPGMLVLGTNIPLNTTIASITNATTFVLSANASAAGTVTLDYVTPLSGLRATSSFATSRTIQFSQTGNSIDVTGGSTLTLNSPFTGVSGTTTLLKADNGTLVLAAANPGGWTGSYTLGQGLTGGVGVVAGALRIANPAALGAATNPIVVLNNTGAVVQIAGGITVPNPLTLNHQNSNNYAGGINWSGGLQSLGSGVTNTWSGLIQENQDSGLSAEAGNTLNVAGGISLNAHIGVFGGAGNINVTGGSITGVHTLDKIGSGTTNIQVATAGPTGNGIRVFGGNLTFSGAGGAVSGGGTVATFINPGGALNLDNSGTVVANRLGGTGRNITFQGGNLNLIGGASAVTEALGTPTFNRGQTTITLAAGAGGANLTFNGPSNSVAPAQSSSPSGATALIRGTNLGSAAGAGVATVAGSAAANGLTINGQTGATGTNTKGIVPWAIIDTTATGLGTSFVTADTAAAATVTGTAVLRPLAAAEYSTATTLTANANMLIATALTGQSSVTPNSLTIDAGGSISMAPLQSLALSSGGVLVRNGVTTTIGGLGIVSLPGGNSPWSVHTVGSAALTIDGVMSGGSQQDRVGLVKAGDGTLTLSTPTVTLPVPGLAGLSGNALGMQTVVNQGKLVLNGGTNTLGANNYLEVGAGGTLDLNGNSQFVLGLFTDGTYNGIPDAVTAGGTVTSTAPATLVVNSDARNWAGQIAGNVFFNRTGTATTTTVYTPQTYTGGTLLNGGTVSLRDYGRLTSTPAIDITFAALTLDNTQASALADRINDTAAITLRGGTFTLLGRAQTDVTETIGAISLVKGLNVVDVQTGGTGVNSSVLTAASLSRPAGSNATVILSRGNSTVDQDGQIGSVPRMLLATPPTLTNDIIGPWAISRRDWVSYDATYGTGRLSSPGFKGYAANALNGAPLATDNIKITAAGTTTLAAATTVNTLNLTVGANTTTTVDLGGNTLTLAAGGLLFGLDGDTQTQSVINGTLTSGFANGAGANDLYVFDLPYGGSNRQAVVAATIANNGATPVRLVVTSSEAAGSGQRTTLNGANTYTGGTVANGGTLVPGATGVIPAGGITLNAAMLDQAPGTQAVPGTINSSNVITLNGPSIVSFVGDNTMAGFVFNNEGGTTAPTVNTFKGAQGNNGINTLTIGASGVVANSSNVQTTAIFVGRIRTDAVPVTFTVNPVTVNGVSVSPLSPALAIQGWSGSVNTTTKAGAGVLQLNGQQIFTGTLNVTEGGIGFGTLGNPGLAANNAAGSRFGRINLADNTFLNLSNTDATLGSLTGTGVVFNQAVTFGTSARTFNLGADDSSFTFAGSFARYSDALANGFQVNKIGSGTMTLTGANTTTHNLQVSQGSVVFSGAGTGLFGTNLVMPTGTLVLDNSGTNVDHRLTGGLGAGGTLTLAGGTVRIIGNASTPTNETIGTLNMGTATGNLWGSGTITLEANPAQPLTLTIAGGLGGVQTGSLGLIRGISATAGNGLANVSLGTVSLNAPAGVGTGLNGSVFMPIRPDILGDASTTGTGTGFITKDSVTGFLRPLTAAELAPAAPNVGGLVGSTVNYGFSSAATLISNAQLGSLTLNSGGGLAVPAGLNSDGLPINPQVFSGGILAFGGNAGLNVGRLQTGGNRAFMFHTQGNLSVGGVLNGTTGGLTKDGAGTLTLNARNLYTGQTQIDAGKVVLNGGDNTLPLLVTAGAPTTTAIGVNGPTAIIDFNGNNQITGTMNNSGNQGARYAGIGGTITNSAATFSNYTTISGSTQGFGGQITGKINFTKTGNNLLTLTNDNTYTGTTTVRANTLQLIDRGKLSGTTAINLFFGGLNLDNSGLSPLTDISPVRVPPTAPIEMRGGTLTMTSGGSIDTIQNLDTVTLSQGYNTLSVPQPSAGGYGKLTLANLVVNPDATVNLTGGSGGYFSALPGINTSNLLFTQLNGTTPTLVNGILPANMICNNGEFATYISASTTGSNGIEWGVITMNGNRGPLGTLPDVYTSNAATFPASNANANVRLAPAANATVTLPTGATTAYNVLAIRDQAGIKVAFNAATDVLNLTAGGLALTSGGVNIGTAVGSGRLTSGGSASGVSNLYIYQSGASATINSIIQDSGVAGAKTRLVVTPIQNQLNLAAVNTYTGGTVINGAGGGVTLTGVGVIPAGGLTINNATLTATNAVNSVASANDVTINGGGVLTLGNFANTLRSLTFNNTGGTATPTVTIGTSSLTLTANDAITAVNDNPATVPTIAGTLLTLAPASGAAVINASTTAGVPTDLVISAPISAALTTPIVKSGSGSLLLSGQSTFAGGLSLNEGTIILGANSASPLTAGPLGQGTLTMAAGTALISDTAVRTVGNPVTINGDITFGSTAGVGNASTVAAHGVVLSGPVNLGNATRTINVNSFLNTSTISGVVGKDALASGVGLTKTGPGTLVLANTANTFDGPVRIEGGALYVAAANSLGDGSFSNTLTFAGGILGHAAGTNADISWRIPSTNGQKIFIDTNGNTVTYASPLTSAGGGSLGKFGAGTLILTADAYYDGDTIISGGNLQVGNGNFFAGSIPSTSNILDGGAFVINRGAGETITHSGTITGAGGIIIDQATFRPQNTVLLGGNLGFGTSNAVTTAGTLDLSVVSAVFGGMLVQNNNATGDNVILPAGKTLTVNGNVIVGLNAPVAGYSSKLTMASGGALVVDNPTGTFIVANRTDAVNQNTTATLDLTGLASTNISVATLGLGWVSAGSSSAAPTVGYLTLAPNNTINAATQILIGYSDATGNTTGASTLTIGTGTTNVTTPLVTVGGRKSNGRLEFAAGGTLNLGNGAGVTDLYIARNNLNTGTNTTGVFDGTGGTFNATLGNIVVAEKTGGGAGSGTGTFTLAAGTVTANSIQIANLSGGSGNAIGTVNLNGGTVVMASAGGGITDGSGVSTLTLNGAALDMSGTSIGSAAQSIDTLNLQSGTLKNVAQINNGAVVTKTTAGTLILDGVNGYTGATAVAGGRLKVTGTILSTSAANVSALATLELAGAAGSATAAGLDVVNVGTLEVSKPAQEVGDISGTGTTDVKASSSLTANSIVQDTLIIGAGGSVTIREIPVAAGNAVAASQSAGAVGAVPEPGTLALLLTLAMAGIAAWTVQRGRRAK